MKHFIFVYGSCMNLKDLNRTTKAEFVSAATLYDYKLGFTRYSHNRKGGVADIIYSAGDYLEGVVFKVDDLKAMDSREGHPHIYRRDKVRVLAHKASAWLEVWTYEVVNKERYEIQPSDGYLKLLQDGADCYLSKQYNKDLTKNLKRFRAPYEIEEEPTSMEYDWMESLKARLAPE